MPEGVDGGVVEPKFGDKLSEDTEASGGRVTTIGGVTSTADTKGGMVGTERADGEEVMNSGGESVPMTPTA